MYEQAINSTSVDVDSCATIISNQHTEDNISIPVGVYDSVSCGVSCLETTAV